MQLDLTDVFFIGENDAYRFGIGRLGDRWVGFAQEGQASERSRRAFRSEGMDVAPGMLFFFPEVSEGFELGVADRQHAILLTGALAQDPENCYGGVEKWHVPEGLRGDPENFRCQHCDRVGCDGSECLDYQGEP